MSKITLSFEIITPLIMSGADRDEVELREQSLKGILRWWFRFYKGAELDLKELKEKESEIWGSQEVASKIKITIKNKKLSSKKNGKDYYAYLCMNDDRGDRYSRIKRRAFHENQKFNIDFYFLPPFNEKLRKELETTLFFLSNLGGLGARWRRGFGSVVIDGYHIDGKNLEEIKNNLNNRLKSFSISSSNRDFMNLSNTSIYLLSPKQKESFWYSWKEAINKLRDDFYRKLKRQLGVNRIGIGSPRAVSPLIIQIKRNKANLYYGVILIWQKWELYEKCIEKMQKLDFEIKEVKI